MTMTMTRGILDGIGRHAEGGYPEEVCGGLLGRVRGDGGIEVLEAPPLTNAREEHRRRRYLVGPDDVLGLERRAEAAGLKVVGYYHSHPDAPARPSEFDREHAWPWYIYLIVSVADGRAVDTLAWRLANGRERFFPVQLSEYNPVLIEGEET